MIYFILTGRKKDYDREINEELKKFILRGISSSKEKRFNSVDEMRDELIKVVFPSIKSSLEVSV